MSSLAGRFLVASSALDDSIFHQSVVLLLQHGETGAFGLVVNRPSSVDGLPFPVFAGGPCAAEGLLLLHGHAEWAKSPAKAPTREVAPGIFLGDESCLKRVSEASSGQKLRFRMFAGYAGWAPNQLEGELEIGAWRAVPAEGPLLFDTPVSDLWNRLEPPTLPRPSVN